MFRVWGFRVQGLGSVVFMKVKRYRTFGAFNPKPTTPKFTPVWEVSDLQGVFGLIETPKSTANL